MRILFAGCPDIALPSLAALAQTHEVCAVLTNPPSSLGSTTTVVPVARLATELGIPIIMSEKITRELSTQIAALDAQLLVCFAYGSYFPQYFLTSFPHGGINVHPSLLPQFRGATPIPAAIRARVTETGVVVQRLAKEMDSGDILAQEVIPLNFTETSESLGKIAATIGAGLVTETVTAIEKGRAQARPQVGTPSFCTVLKKEDGLIDWHNDALSIDAQVRAHNPWPIAYSFLRSLKFAILEARPYPSETQAAECGTIVTVDKERGIMVQTQQGLLGLVRVQLQNKKALHFRDFVNGTREIVGIKLGLK